MKDIVLGFELAEIAKLILDDLRETTENLGVVSSYRPFLFHLSQNEKGLTQSELVGLIHFKAPTVSITLQKMEYEGLIRKEVDENDQRITRIFIAEKGKLFEDRIKQIHENLENDLSSLFSQEEKDLLIEYLGRIKNKIKERKEK